MKSVAVNSRRILFQALAVLVLALAIVFVVGGMKEKYIDYSPSDKKATSCGAPQKIRTGNDLFHLEGNICDPKCCPSELSCSNGCVCLTDAQKRIMMLRGNNRATAGDTTF